MPGVMFSKSAAKRIADGIRKVERIPGGEQDLQRRRAGGLGRSTLWEVTAVQTGPETVTIKRVSNIDFDLNDLSEKTDILYDPSDAPSVGNRGLLIRLGEGPLFFFRRAAISRVYINEHCYVKSDDVNVAFGGPTTAIALTTPDNATKHVGIFKFASVLPSAGGQDITIVLAKSTQGINSGTVTGFGVSGRVYTLNVRLEYIKEDFDTSSLTYAQYSALDKVSLATVGNIWDIDSAMTTDITFTSFRTAKDRLILSASAFASLFSPSYDVYGIAITLVLGEVLVAGTFSGTFVRTMGADGDYLSWIEWDI